MLQKSTVEEGTFGLLKELQSLPLLKDFYLVGGTALALYMGHRKSIDLDLFSFNSFDVQEIEHKLSEHYDLQTHFANEGTLLTYIEGIKVDFIRYPYEFIRPPHIEKEEGIRLASIEDIVAMKLSAIAMSGKRLKDFVDLSYLSCYYSLNEMLNLYDEKFPTSNRLIPLKAVNYFDEIRFDEDVIMLEGQYSWQLIKQRLEQMFSCPDKRFRQAPLPAKSPLVTEAEQTLGLNWKEEKLNSDQHSQRKGLKR